jgi:hypothetical protein
VSLRTILSPVKEIMPDCCTPEYERVLGEFGALLPYRRARTLLGTFFPVGDLPTIDSIQRRTLQVGARLECEAVVTPTPPLPPADAETIALSIDAGHVRAVRNYQVRTFEVCVAQASNDDGEQTVFSSVLVEADRQTQQLRGALHRLGATPRSDFTILSDGADGPRSLGEAASIGLTCHGSTGSILRCASSMSPRQSTAGPTLPTETGRTAPSSPMLWSGARPLAPVAPRPGAACT